METNEGHRQRLRDKFTNNGLDSFHDHEILELLLFYAIPRRNTNGIAHELIKTFGSLSDVLDAPVEKLKAVDGIGDNAATLLKLMPQIARRYSMSKGSFDNILDTTQRSGDYILPFFLSQRDEVVLLVCLDSKNKVLNAQIIHRGSVNSTDISLRKILETAFTYNATKVLLAHNHPSGIALPSVEDIETTKYIRDALKILSIKLVDHIIVADGDYVSMADTNLI
jgi:DNA repair protein RadC